MSQHSRRAALKAQQEAEARAGRRKKVIGVVAGLAVNGKNWDAWQGWYDQKTGQWSTRPTAELLLSSIQKTA